MGAAIKIFHWFNAFRLMKCVHALRDTAYPNRPLATEARHLLDLLEPLPALPKNSSDDVALLWAYRRLDGLDDLDGMAELRPQRVN